MGEWGGRWKSHDGNARCKRPLNFKKGKVLCIRTLRLTAKRWTRSIADLPDVDRSEWVEDLNGDLRWIHRDRVIEIRQPYWMDVERFTLVTQLDHPSNANGLPEPRVPLRKGL